MSDNPRMYQIVVCDENGTVWIHPVTVSLEGTIAAGLYWWMHQPKDIVMLVEWGLV